METGGGPRLRSPGEEHSPDGGGGAPGSEWGALLEAPP